MGILKKRFLMTLVFASTSVFLQTSSAQFGSNVCIFGDSSLNNWTGGMPWVNLCTQLLDQRVNDRWVPNPTTCIPDSNITTQMKSPPLVNVSLGQMLFICRVADVDYAASCSEKGGAPSLFSPESPGTYNISYNGASVPYHAQLIVNSTCP